jgi:hypothetical protein
MIAVDQSVPDLLRRFISTPHRARVLLGDAELAAETNDLALLIVMRQAATAESNDRLRRTLRMKLVRDPDAPCDCTHVTVIRAWPLLTLLAGTGTVLSLDLERDEILGFVAADVSAERIWEELLPMLLMPFSQAPSPERESSTR